MKRKNMINIMGSVINYKKLSLPEKELVRQERLRELVSYAQNKSPYFNKLYTDISEDFKLSDLPVTNKVELMEHFDEWITDRDIKLEDINKFMKNLDNIGRKFNGRYMVFTTSGSTGNPLVVLYDKYTKNVLDAVSIFRSFARKEDMKAFIKRGGKSAGVYATGGFYLGNSTIRSKQLAMPWKKKKVVITSILKPMNQIVDELNKFGPAMLGGYPTALDLLADEQNSGNLYIKPAIVMTGGEYLSDELRDKLKKVFGCYVQTNYACTEGGMVSGECSGQHFHVNDDWIIVEPVDKDNNPIEDGERADKWLLTNLSNFTQPFIRYEITDRIILHKEGCECGNPSPWIEIEGRTDEILIFKHINDQEDVKLAPLAFYAILKEVHEIERFQLILHENNKLELRLIADNKLLSFEKAKDKLEKYLLQNEVSPEIYLSDLEPRRHPQSGKFKHVYKEF